ncbi:MAG: hypothetical protein R3F29_08880 [Planctomycetota bacterium]
MPLPRKLLTTLLLLGLLAVTLGRTLRWPNDWAEAHWLLDYRFGFVKRGLLGQLLQWAAAPFGGEVGEGAIRAVSAVAAVGFVVLLGWTVWRVLRATAFAPGAVAVAAAFVASPFLVMTGHLVGYYDHVVFAVGIVSIWLVLRRRPWLGALLQAGSLLAHEACIVLIFPAFTLALLLQNARVQVPEEGDAPPRTLRLLPLRPLLPLLPPLVVAALMGRVVGAPPPGFMEQYGAWLARHDFLDPGFAPQVAFLLTWKLGDFVQVIWSQGGGRLMQASNFGLLLPATTAILLLTFARARARAWSLETLAIVFVALVPQAMHVVAFDLERIVTFSIFTAWLSLWIVCEHDGAPVDRAPGPFGAALLAVAAGVLMTTPLMDNEVDRLAGVWRMVVAAVAVAALCGLHLAAHRVTARR